ncbi:cyclic nucleotide-binding domain-containing protein [Cytophagaceae bacterium DM2B3-1]|uniref:Cyclic nucleotide-binding domain-containing protein n=1 Tax=Xanthocytophaga flava TaxID=3048013 RepID=A0ABT7CZ73_9BACT|nr:cyclic nucleotide-binding domain-containing protein [Xanthocytophaga flavus]MDJ1498260.1 cyclic nucleotide-binding domain-containing protein [Xanthocytophaga flavus]
MDSFSESNTDNSHINITDFQALEIFAESKIYPAKTILLREGEIAKKIFLIKYGCVRAWLNHDGVEVSLQFFFEGEMVTSFESFMHKKAGLINIETIESS